MLELDARSGRIIHHFQATAADVNQGTPPHAGPGPDFDFDASPNLFVGPNGRPMVGEGQKSGVYWALDRRTMRLVWRADVATDTIANVGGVIGSTALADGQLFGPGARGGKTWSVSTSGAPIWTTFGAGLYHLGPVSVANGVTYSTDEAGQLSVRSAATGALLRSLPLGFPSWGGVTIAGPTVIAVTGTQRQATGDMVAFSAP
jgi:polyvinyl alcohol dehydrogenase (cytochrome)